MSNLYLKVSAWIVMVVYGWFAAGIIISSHGFMESNMVSNKKIKLVMLFVFCMSGAFHFAKRQCEKLYPERPEEERYQEITLLVLVSVVASVLTALLFLPLK